MKKKKYSGSCGICEVSFINVEAMAAHFKSKKHLDNINNPKLMAKKIKESQTNLIMNVLDIPKKEKRK